MFSGRRKLRIGYFTSLSYWPPVGDTEDVVLAAKLALERQGHTLIPFKMPDSFEMMDLVFDFAFADKGELLLKNWYVCIASLVRFIKVAKLTFESVFRLYSLTT